MAVDGRCRRSIEHTYFFGVVSRPPLAYTETHYRSNIQYRHNGEKGGPKSDPLQVRIPGLGVNGCNQPCPSGGAVRVDSPQGPGLPCDTTPKLADVLRHTMNVMVA